MGLEDVNDACEREPQGSRVDQNNDEDDQDGVHSVEQVGKEDCPDR